MDSTYASIKSPEVYEVVWLHFFNVISHIEDDMMVKPNSEIWEPSIVFGEF